MQEGDVGASNLQTDQADDDDTPERCVKRMWPYFQQKTFKELCEW